MKKLFTVALVLVAYATAAQAQIYVADRNQTTKTIKKEADEKPLLSEFDNIHATYSAWFDAFDKGFYGVGMESYGKNTVFTLSLNGSWGLTDPGLYQGRVGYGVGYAFNKFFAVSCPLQIMLGEAVNGASVDKYGNIKYDTGFMGGLLLSPGIRLKCGGIIIGAGFDIGWAQSSSASFYKDFNLKLGFKF